MTKSALPSISMADFDFKTLVADFKSLDPKDPGVWPLLPRVIILIGLFLVVLAVAAWFGWRVQMEELGQKQQQEAKLKDEWLEKKKQAVNLEEYERQLAEINRSFGALLKQLPNKSEMESLLVDINQSGLGRGLQFELFKPAGEIQKEFYAELPITIKILGPYHDLGAFTGDIAKLPRIVTLNDIEVTPAKDGGLTLQGTAKTFRYLDEEEIARQRKEKEKDKAAKGKAGGRK